MLGVTSSPGSLPTSVFFQLLLKGIHIAAGGNGIPLAVPSRSHLADGSQATALMTLLTTAKTIR